MVVARVVLIVVLGWGSLARAESADELQAQGEAAAKAGDFAGAIDHFKAADKLEVHASHACLIALAYLRRNLWAQAELWRAHCHDRASGGTDPLPDWIAEADAQFDALLAKANVAEVTIAVTPGDARLAISGFAPDETFAPRVIHLPPGTYELTASAPGYGTEHRTIEIRDKTAQHIAIALGRPAARTHSPKSPWVVIGAGVALGMVGAVLEATWYRSRYNAVEADVPGTEGSDVDRWRSARRVVIGCYVGAALAIGVGVVLHETLQPSVEVRDGGAVVSVAWRR